MHEFGRSYIQCVRVLSLHAEVVLVWFQTDIRKANSIFDFQRNIFTTEET